MKCTKICTKFALNKTTMEESTIFTIVLCIIYAIVLTAAGFKIRREQLKEEHKELSDITIEDLIN